jgi:eukaryotic-like serine/threonine-protein kinase
MNDATRRDKLERLFRQWQEQRKQGHTTSIAELCWDCPELRLELERRIQQEPGDTHAGIEPTNIFQQILRSSPSESAPTPPPLLPGYEIIGELGRGGMGVVYKAFDPRLKRPVAIKMALGGKQASSPLLQRFKSEMESVAQLKHPNIVQIYECGEQNGQPYCVLEFVEGKTLQERFASQSLSSREAALLVAILARAMQTAHRKGIVHRDLKPANILLEENVQAPGVTISWGCPKITDFGLVKRLGQAISPTAEGALLGTPSYMSPEQASGENQTVGPASDIYTLGTLLYEALAGRPPFVCANPVETMVKVIEEPPPPPSALGKNVPLELERICLKCLEKNPIHRYPSAAALAEDLEDYLQGNASAATMKNLEALRSMKNPTRRRWLLLAAGAIVLLAILWYFWSSGKSASPIPDSPGPIRTSTQP